MATSSQARPPTERVFRYTPAALGGCGNSLTDQSADADRSPSFIVDLIAMVVCGRLFFLIAFLMAGVSLSQDVAAQSLRSNAGTGEQAVSPLHDDANLHDVRFVGSKFGWAVGDRGVIRHTRDGGQTWRFIPSPVDCPLRSICFLTDRVGWIVGGGTRPFARVGYGVLLFTADGGKTWKQPATIALPRLFHVRFFDLQHGVVVAEPTSDHPSGVFVTDDAGKTWQDLPGGRPAAWRTAAFSSLKTGLVAGLQGRITRVGGDRLVEPRLGDVGPRGIHGLTLDNRNRGWLVGDGGLVLQTGNAGISWQPPTKRLPAATRDLFDFRAVAARGAHAWIAGSPGSVIWHTSDGGHSWSQQPTGNPQPIHALHFSSETAGTAVGALGTILHTADGGQSWAAVHGKSRRTALMAIHTRANGVSFRLLAKQSAEQGYRSIVLLPLRRNTGTSDATDLDLRLTDAVTMSGGSATEIDWRLSLNLPGLDRNRLRLIKEWNRQTESRLEPVLMGRLVARLRTWRPDVVVLESPAADDAASTLINDAVARAIKQAADPTQFISHRETAGLPTWRVKKVFVRLPSGSSGEIHIEPFELLPRIGKPIAIAAAAAESIAAQQKRSTGIEAYRLLQSATGREKRTGGDLFAGLVLAPGSAGRRHLLPLDREEWEKRTKLAQRQRNFRAYSEKFLNDPRLAAQLIGQLRQNALHLPDDQAALQMQRLIAEYRRRSEWELAESTAVELVGAYPNEPASLEAMQWLFHLWGGAEPTWQRLRRREASGEHVVVNAAAVVDRVQKAIAQARYTPRPGQQGPTFDMGPDPLQVLHRPGRTRIGDQAEFSGQTAANWQTQAIRMAAFLRAKSPELYRTPIIQFPLASLYRKQGFLTDADAIHRSFDRADTKGSWQAAAATELWMLAPNSLPPKKLTLCRKAAERPRLDGVLSDACWQKADEIRLASNDNSRPYAFAMLAYDADYLYLAASVPRQEGVRNDRPTLAGRRHDADLLDFDRLGLFLDIDRDWATYYALEVDQRGWTTDRCWENRSWTPKWHVAAAADGKHWRIEAAIPFRELTPRAPQKNNIWGLGLLRTIPAYRHEGWPTSTGNGSRPETFGLLKFD